MFYCCKTLTDYYTHAKKINRFRLDCLRDVLKKKRQYKIPDTEVPKCANMLIIHTSLGKHQLRWAVNAVRMDGILPKHLFYGELTRGKGTIGGQYKHFGDTLKANLKKFGVKVNITKSCRE